MTTKSRRRTRIRALGSEPFEDFTADYSPVTIGGFYDDEAGAPPPVPVGKRCNVFAGKYHARCVVSESDPGAVTEEDGERVTTYTSTLKVQSVWKMLWPERVYRRVRFWWRGVPWKRTMRRVRYAPLRLVNWAHKGKRLWVVMFCGRAGAGLSIHRVRGDEALYLGTRLPGFRARVYWGMQWSCQRPKYGVEVTWERWGVDER